MSVTENLRVKVRQILEETDGELSAIPDNVLHEVMACVAKGYSSHDIRGIMDNAIVDWWEE